MKNYLVIFLCLFLFISCKKDKGNSAECIAPAIVPYQPYSDPVWHPNGTLLGFNHTPQVGVFKSGRPPCEWYMNTVNSDSAGFYLMNKDGSGFRRITDYYLNTPAWSPDGEWLVFSLRPHIYKMHFDGTDFDTANIIRLTTAGNNFYPAWTPEGDSIYYDSNADTNQPGYYVWKMAANGTEHTPMPGTGRQPFVGMDGKVYYCGGANGQPEIFSMNRNGTTKKQITFNGKEGNRDRPVFVNGFLFYTDNGKLRKVSSSGQDEILTFPANEHSVSLNNEIVYVKTDWQLNNNIQRGTLWLINTDGTNNRQLTFNNR